MRLRYDRDDKELKAAIAFCDDLFQQDDFWTAVENDGPFTNTTISAKQIADTMRSNPNIVDVHHFKPNLIHRIKYRSTVAMVDPKRAFKIFYHTKFLDNSIAQMVNTIVHEYVHVVDFFADGDHRIEYSHNGQTRAGNARSAPYAIGAIAESFYRIANTSPQSMGVNKANKGLDGLNTLIGNSDFCGVDHDDMSLEDDEIIS